MKKILNIYISPYASQVNAKAVKNEFEKIFFRHNFEIKSPSNLNQLTDELKKDSPKRDSIIACIGGDGTINKIINSIDENQNCPPFLILPSGTANDLGNELGLENSIKFLKKLVQYDSIKKVDIIDVNHTAFLTTGGIGIGSDLCDFINQKRHSSAKILNFLKSLKSESYSLALTHLLLTKPFKTYKLKIKADHLDSNGIIVETPFLAISNQNKVAGKLPLAPYTKNNDGQFSVSIFLDKNRFTFIEKLIRLRKGESLLSEKGFIQFETNQLSVEHLSQTPLSFFGDGDILLKDTKFHLSVRPQKQAFYYLDSAKTYLSEYSLDEVSPL